MTAQQTTVPMRLSAEPAEILSMLPDLGDLMVVAKGDHLTHERIGPVESVWAGAGFATISGPCHDSQVLTMQIDRILFDRSTVMREKVYPRLDFLRADGTKAVSIVGMGGLEPFDTALVNVAQTPALDVRDADEGAKSKAEISEADPALAPFEAAIASGVAVTIKFRSESLQQSWQGKIEKLHPAMGFLNVMTPDFHLHLKGGAVARWQVDMTSEGPVLAAIGADGAKLGLSLRTERLADLGAEHASLTHHPMGRWISPDDGQELSHGALMERMAQQQVILLGETHDRADIHRWQLHVAAGIMAHRADIALGFEMFPRRLQPVLDAWVEGGLDEPAFLEAAEWKKVWGFPADLYLPLFRFCREFQLPMLALNCRRALVTEVGKLGWDAIPESDRDGLTPAKPATPAYRQRLRGLVSNATAEAQDLDDPMDPAWDRFVRAQQCWDRAFACNIKAALDRPNPPLVIGIIGQGHLEWGHGAPFQLADLGVTSTATLLPTYASEFNAAQTSGRAEAVFRLKR